MDHGSTNRVVHHAWKSKDFKASDDILLHHGKKQLISPRSITTSKVVWDKLNQLYQHSNKAS
jgi:hypothetical protein